jgi:SAM-dependent methyltransferase
MTADPGIPSAHETAKPICWIGYTTLYREGGPELERAAKTMAEAKRKAGFEVRMARVESKRDVVKSWGAVAAAGQTLTELHFVGHSGMYGPMFRTTAMPEQFSPHEWRTLTIPFADDGQAFFHACRSARWFAPFFARTFGVPTHGFHWYTSFSTRTDRFVWPSPLRAKDAPLYLIGCPGKKSHGLVGSAKKYAGLARAETMKRFDPPGQTSAHDESGSYDPVADLYDAVFRDIRVRADEWQWLTQHLDAAPAMPRVLDIGCGNGALLRELEPRIALGRGVDASAGMLTTARRQTTGEKLAFEVIDGPALPYPDQSFDVVVSLLSFRYLDWDPLMNEIRRVLAPGGRILIIDMVTAPVAVPETPRFLQDTARAALFRARHRPYREALARLVKHPGWRKMLAYNPIRAQHEMVWYLESRFPGRIVETLNIGRHARVLAFDSGPLEPGWVAPQSYP